MSTIFRAACIQLRSGKEAAANVSAAAALIREAKAQGAHFAATPEMTTLFESEGEALMAKVHADGHDPALRQFQALAEELDLWLLIGSMAVKLSDSQCANRSFLIGPDGRIRARYDKIHMFDVQVGDGQSYRESSRYRPGEEAVVASLPWANLGMTVCYDLRFAGLYRALAKAGANVLTVPAAFTHVTGTAHWHVLLRARAIETGSFVIAPAQCGVHENGRHTFGHSLIIGPWGEVLAEGRTEPGVFLADVDLALSASARAKIPALTHDRIFHLKSE